MKKSRGFTLIELLVVISIIGLLSSVVLASLNTAKTRAQDAAIISNVRSLKTAMELYYNDHHEYPNIGTEGTAYPLSNAALASALVPKYVGSIPVNLTGLGYYIYRLDAGGGYGLKVWTKATGFCRTGVNLKDVPGWWFGVSPDCPF